MTEENQIVIQQQNYLAPVVDIRVALARFKAVNDFISAILKDGVDYGKVPGSEKPALLKPGAEKLSSFFGLGPRFELLDKVEDWTGEAHNGEPFFYYRYGCNLYKGDVFIANSEGSCNSWEKKYRYRQATLKCPTCEQPAIFKSKNNPGWFCWGKKGGCGATFGIDDKRITGQDLKQIKNPDPADQVNTIQKMAEKRALVAAVLIATNASERFTQDIEDYSDEYIEATFVETKNEKETVVQQAPAPTETRPYSPTALNARLKVMADSFAGQACTDGQRKSIRINLTTLAGGDANYPEYLEYLTGFTSSADMPDNWVLAVSKWLGVHKDGDSAWVIDDMAQKEGTAVFSELLGKQESV